MYILQKKRDENQKNLVEKSKREFIVKILPILDGFQDAQGKAPPTCEREENMHKNFGSLYTSIVAVVEKYGYKLFDGGRFSSIIIIIITSC